MQLKERPSTPVGGPFVACLLPSCECFDLDFEREIAEIVEQLERASFDEAELWRLVNGEGPEYDPAPEVKAIETGPSCPVQGQRVEAETIVTSLPPTFAVLTSTPLHSTLSTNTHPAPSPIEAPKNLQEHIAHWRSTYKPRQRKSPRAIFDRPALKPWKRLTTTDKLKRCLQVLWEQGECSDMTLKVDRKLMKAAWKNKRGPLDHFYRRLSLELPKAFGHPVDFFIAGELSQKGDFHMHGVIGLGEDDYARAKQAFWKACGKWDTGARQNQFKLRPMPDYGWIGYMLKENPGFEGTREGIVRSLKQKAMSEHNRIVALGKIKCNHCGDQ